MRLSVCLLFIWLASQPAAAQSGKETSIPAGTLSCMMSAEPHGSEEAAVACSFKALSGRSSEFSGTLVRTSAELPRGKRVLLWSVLAATDAVEPSELTGRYVGRTGGDNTGRLLNESARIILVPPAATSGVGGEADVTVLTLRPAPVRA